MGREPAEPVKQKPVEPSEALPEPERPDPGETETRSRDPEGEER